MSSSHHALARLALAALLCVASPAQEIFRWDASTGATLESSVPPFSVGTGGSGPSACNLGTIVQTPTALVLDTTACPGDSASLVQILWQPVHGPAPATVWLEARVRVPLATGGHHIHGAFQIRLIDRISCAWTVDVDPDEIRLSRTEQHPFVYGVATVDMVTAPRTLRFEIDPATYEARVFVDGLLVLSALPMPWPCTPLSQWLITLGEASQHVGGLVELYSIEHNAVPYSIEFCAPTTASSSGSTGHLEWSGSRYILDADFTLRASALPAGAFGYFLASPAHAPATTPPASQGALCLGAPIGRFNRPGEVLQASAAGSASLSIDLLAVPQPTGAVAIQPGERWHFQMWFRDANPTPTSNTTSAVRVSFE
jgi:hypothetical protein